MRKSRRARNILLHVDLDGSVELVVPWRVSYRAAQRFLHSRQNWIIRQRSLQARRKAAIPKRVWKTGTILPAFGAECVLQVIIEDRKRSHVAYEPGFLHIRAHATHDITHLVERWYRKQAQKVFGHRAQLMAEQHGLSVSHVRINGAKTQWGSCNNKKRIITLNWKLALASHEVAQYVIAHEVAHLRYPNHSRQYWNFVAQLFPHYRQQRTWLRTHGHTLVL